MVWPLKLHPIPFHPTDNGVLFSTLIARTAKDIDILIESLPNQEYTQEKQDAALRKLEAENRLAAEKLTRAVEEGGKVTLSCSCCPYFFFFSNHHVNSL